MAQALDRNLALELVRATESAALAAGRWMGRGDEHAVDRTAIDAMRLVLQSVDMDGRVVIGEDSMLQCQRQWQHTKNSGGSLRNCRAISNLTANEIAIPTNRGKIVRVATFILPNCKANSVSTGASAQPQKVPAPDCSLSSTWAARSSRERMNLRDHENRRDTGRQPKRSERC